MLGWLIIVSRCGSRTLREARGDANAIRTLPLETTGSADMPTSTHAEERLATFRMRCALDEPWRQSRSGMRVLLLPAVASSGKPAWAEAGQT